MRLKFIRKHVKKEVILPSETIVPVAIEIPEKKTNNNKKKDEKAMDIEQIEKLANELTPEQTTKRIKKDKGLIERVESSKVLITEDNKQLLHD